MFAALRTPLGSSRSDLDAAGYQSSQASDYGTSPCSSSTACHDQQVSSSDASTQTPDDPGPWEPAGSKSADVAELRRQVRELEEQARLYSFIVLRDVTQGVWHKIAASLGYDDGTRWWEIYKKITKTNSSMQKFTKEHGLVFADVRSLLLTGHNSFCDLIGDHVAHTCAHEYPSFVSQAIERTQDRTLAAQWEKLWSYAKLDYGELPQPVQFKGQEITEWYSRFKKTSQGEPQAKQHGQGAMLRKPWRPAGAKCARHPK